MSAAPPGDGAIVTVSVDVSPAIAFEVFTEEIDLWWKHGPRYRVAGRGIGRLTLEPRLGGRVLETLDREAGSRTFEIGRILTWEPPERLVLEWRNVNFRPDEKTEVEVRFESHGDGTRVTVAHRGWAALRAGHPARHGAEGAAFSRRIGMWWADLLTALREHIAQRSSAT